MKKRLTALMALLLVVSLVFSACGFTGTEEKSSAAAPAAPADSADPAASEAPAAEAVSGGVLRVSMAGAPSDINPLTASTTEAAELIGCMYEGLVRQDANGQVLPGSGVAKDWTISDDGLVYTFTLKDEAVWSNGDPITADQFVYAWEKVLNPATASQYSYMLYYIKNATPYNTGELTDFNEVGVKALDDKTLEVTLEAPTDYFLECLVISEYGPLPVNYVEDAGTNIYLDVEHMVSNGPFICTEWIPDVSMTFVKNENYWDADSVKLDGVKYEFVMDTNTIINLYETGELDVMLVQPEFLSTYNTASGFVCVVEPVTEYLKFNYNNEYFANENIRRAFSMALNRAEYMTAMATGSTPAYAYVPGSVRGPAGSSFRDGYGDLYTDANPDEAKALLAKGLEELGKTADDLNGIGLSLVIGEGDLNLKTAQIFQQYWKNVLGMDITVRSMRYALRQEAYDTNDWTIAKEGWGADYNDAMSFLDLFESTSPYNDCGYASAEYDALIEQIRNSAGDERQKLLQDAEKMLVQDDACIAPTFFQARSWVCKDNVQGIVRQGCGLRCDYKWASVN